MGDMLAAHQLFEKLKFIPLEELQRFDVRKLPLAEQVKAFAESSEHVRFLAADVINPLLQAAMATGSTDREKAVVGCYYRAYAWMFTLAILREPIHFQAVAAGARSLFELWVDLKLLLGDPAGRAVERYHAFPRVERFRAAQKIVEFSDTHPAAKIDCTRQRTLVDDPTKQQEIASLVVKLWGKDKKRHPRYLRHWSGQDLPARIPPGETEMEQIYNEQYPLLSWYVHSGSAGYAGLDDNALRCCFALSHTIAQRASLVSLELVAREMKIMQAVEWLPDAIEKTRLVPGLLMFQDKFGDRSGRSEAVTHG
jgi:hypothetical protein